jgi:hypothetical protein
VAFAYSVFVAAAVVYLGRMLISSDRASGVLYLQSAVLLLGHAVVVGIVDQIWEIFEGSMMAKAVNLATMNIFACMMLYFHWPPEGGHWKTLSGEHPHLCL